jgi:CspA family cold shock protein
MAKQLSNHGNVKFYNDKKGFGFITDADSQDEYFFHVSGTKETLKKDDAVNYNIADGKKGPQAVDIELA